MASNERTFCFQSGWNSFGFAFSSQALAVRKGKAGVAEDDGEFNRIWPITKSQAAASGTPIRTASSSASFIPETSVAQVVSTTPGSRIAICSTVMRCIRRMGAYMAAAIFSPSV